MSAKLYFSLLLPLYNKPSMICGCSALKSDPADLEDLVWAFNPGMIKEDVQDYLVHINNLQFFFMAPCAATQNMGLYFVHYHTRTRLTVLHPLWTNKNPTTHFKTTVEKNPTLSGALPRLSRSSCCVNIFPCQVSVYAKYLHDWKWPGRWWIYFLNQSQGVSHHTCLKSGKGIC